MVIHSDPAGCRVGIMRNGHSVHFMWCLSAAAASWYCPIRTPLKSIFERGLAWTVFTSADIREARVLLMQANFLATSKAELRSIQKRERALERWSVKLN